VSVDGQLDLEAHGGAVELYALERAQLPERLVEERVAHGGNGLLHALLRKIRHSCIVLSHA
jgi:hypothetical protein